MNDGLTPSESARLFNNKKTSSNKNGRVIEKVRIHTLLELKQLVNRIKPGKTEAPKPIVLDTKEIGMADETYDGNVIIPQSGGQATIRETLLDGFKMVKNHLEYYNASMASQSAIDEYGGFPPALAPNPDDHRTWLDTFIDRNMGGHREGLFICWDLPEGKFRLDPWSCKLEKVDAS